jgi:FdhE protein
VILPVKSRGPAVDFERRSERAELLASVVPDAEPLLFAAWLLRAQAAVAVTLEIEHAAHPLSGRLAKDAGRILHVLLELPRFAARQAPEPLAAVARARASEDAETALSRLRVFWSGDRSSAEDYLSRAMLRPYLEVMRSEGHAPDRSLAAGRCPFCGGAPAVGALRGGAKEQGAGRFLVCALCGLEWAVNRILCPSCGERDPAKLPCFSSAGHPAVRLEACETCSRYVKSLDLSSDARPIPEIDDLASLALDIWARERGLTRLEPGLAGI